MSRINMTKGITAEQVNEANAAFIEYAAMLDVSDNVSIDIDVAERAAALVNEAAGALSAVFGSDHLATRRAEDAAQRAQVAIIKLREKIDGYTTRLDKLRAKVRSYDGWFVMIDGERVHVTEVITVNGEVQRYGDMFPFVPVYFPSQTDGLAALFDDVETND